MAETKADPPCHPASAAAADAEHRFIDCGNGTVHDTLSGVLWLEDASCAGELDDGVRERQLRLVGQAGWRLHFRRAVLAAA